MHIFVSYNFNDGGVVLPIVDHLKSDGLTLWVAERDMHAGSHIVPEVIRGREQCEAMICFVSRNNREWVSFEVGGAFVPMKDRLIPVRLDDSLLPGFLQDIKYIDWFPDPDDAYAQLLSSCRQITATPRSSGPSMPPRTLDEILGLCNRAALSLYNDYVRNEPANDHATFDRPREDIAGGYWNTVEYAAQRNYVPVRLFETPEFILQKVCQLLSEGFGPQVDTHIWVIGDAGTGKTTTMYRIYFEILQSRERARQQSLSMPYPIPVLIQLQKVQERLIEKLSSTRDETDFIAAVFDIWLRRRFFNVSGRDMPGLQAQFFEGLRGGEIVLLIDSYDELGRMAVQLGVFQRLFNAAKHYVAASRPELYREGREHQALRIQPIWDLASIRGHLDRIFSGAPGIARGLAAYIERKDNTLWLRNARYLDFLGTYVTRRLRSGEISTADILATLDQGQYSLLRTLYQETIERIRAIWPASPSPPGPRDPFERNVRRHLQAIALSQIETGSHSVAVDDPDDTWEALAGHASEIVGRRTDYTSNDDQFFLVSYNWIDFFLVDVIIHDMLEEAPSRPLRLQHRWTQTLLTYTAENAAETHEGRKLSQRIRARLEVIRAEALSRRAKEIDSNDGLNLVQMLVRLLSQRDERNELDPHAHLEFVDDDFSWLDLDSVDLHRLSFRRCNFSHARLTKANLERTHFERCDFMHADLRRADANHAVFIDCTFSLDPESNEAESQVAGMSIQGALVKSDSHDRTELFRHHGAIGQRSRYRSPFGKLFFARQQQMLGEGLQRMETTYLAEIGAALRSSDPNRKQLVDLMAGGGNRRLVELLQRDPTLFVLAIDRDGRDMNEIVTKVGERFAMIEKEIDGATDLRALAAGYFDPPSADVVIAKKALHELPRDAQMTLIQSIAGVLRDNGRFVVFADSPYEIDEAGRERLSRLRNRIASYADPDLEPLRSELLAQRFDPLSRSDLAVFSNLWVHLKDWANGNDRELRNRYFSSAYEIIEWAAAAGLRQVGEATQDCYQLVARRFNESGYNLARHRLEESNDEIHPHDIAFYREALEGTERFRLFCDVVEHHLWDAGNAQPTVLGAMLNATRKALDLDGLHPSLRAETIGLSYDSGIGFDFTIHVLTFEKRGARSAGRELDPLGHVDAKPHQDSEPEQSRGDHKRNRP